MECGRTHSNTSKLSAFIVNFKVKNVKNNLVEKVHLSLVSRGNKYRYLREKISTSLALGASTAIFERNFYKSCIERKQAFIKYLKGVQTLVS
ncbi:hypothetical protein CsatB_026025 [Cannabis sativa]